MHQKAYTKDDLHEHLASEHGKNGISTYIKEVVYGGIDGIITTFAVVAGFTGVASLDNDQIAIPIIAVLVFGLANLLADGFSMGVGEFLSARSERKYYEKEKQKELIEIERSREMEIAESEMILQERGFTKQQAEDLVAIYKTNPEFWVEFMMRYEIELDEPDESPFKNAVATFFSFLIFGFVPLIPYFFNNDALTTFLMSSISALFALIILGIMRSLITKENMLRSILEISSLGALAGLIAFLVGKLFG